MGGGGGGWRDSIKSKLWNYLGFDKDSAGSLHKISVMCKTCTTALKYTGSTKTLAIPHMSTCCMKKKKLLKI